VTHPAVLLLILSGLASVFLNDWGLIYRANLILHPLLGVAFTLVMYYFAWRRFHRLGAAFSARLWVGLPAFLSVTLPLVGFGAAALRFYAFAFTLGALLVVGMFRLARAIAVREWLVAAFNYGGFGLWSLSVYSGLAVIRMAEAGGITYIVLFHRVIGMAFSITFVLMILLSLAGVFAKSQSFADEQPRVWESLLALLTRGRAVADDQPRAWSALVYALLASGCLAGLVALERASDLAAPAFTVSLSPLTLARRAAGDRTMAFADPRVAPAAVELTSSCEGCHSEIARSLRDSNHAVSMATPHVAKLLSLLRSEEGAANTKACAACHAPAALFDPREDDAWLANHPDMSCSFCHSVRDVQVNTPRETLPTYTLRPPLGHVGLFLQNGVEKTPEWLNSFLIRLSPVSHGRQFSAPVLASDRFCEACHLLQIPVEEQRGLVKPRCIDCHMRPLHEMGQGPGEVRSHFFPGANAAVARFAHREESANLISRWIAGDYPFSISGWENRGWERLGGRPLATWLWMIYQTKDEAVPGHDFSLAIRTANVGVEHQFPAAPLDLAEAWLEVRVRDAQGQTLFQSGIADAGGRIPPDGHRLGGRVLDEDGRPVEHYRVWRPEHDVVDRVIDQGRTTDDRYSFHIPTTAQGPLSVQAEWKYRKLSREFVDWAYGSATAIPSVVVGSLNAKIDLRTTAGP
jgi:hypothetical protein